VRGGGERREEEEREEKRRGEERRGEERRLADAFTVWGSMVADNQVKRAMKWSSFSSRKRKKERVWDGIG
jgi:hypothetical protein